MADKLTLTCEFNYDPNDDFGWLGIEAEASLPIEADAPRFYGSAGFWVQWQDVAEWATKLKGYPLPSDGVEQEWGFTEEGTYQRVILIRMRQTGARGRVEVAVDLTNHYDARYQCRLAFETTYSRLSNFGEQVEQVMDRSAQRAELLGE